MWEYTEVDANFIPETYDTMSFMPNTNFFNSEGQKVSKFYQEINGKLMDHSGARPRKALEESGMEEQGGSGEF